jgi:hypothetical protein
MSQADSIVAGTCFIHWPSLSSGRLSHLPHLFHHTAFSHAEAATATPHTADKTPYSTAEASLQEPQSLLLHVRPNGVIVQHIIGRDISSRVVFVHHATQVQRNARQRRACSQYASLIASILVVPSKS